MRSYYEEAGHNQISDRSGRKMKSSEGRREWTGRIVHWTEWEMRHPQDLIRVRAEEQRVDSPRPRPTDTFLGDNEVTAASL